MRVSIEEVSLLGDSFLDNQIQSQFLASEVLNFQRVSNTTFMLKTEAVSPREKVQMNRKMDSYRSVRALHAGMFKLFPLFQQEEHVGWWVEIPSLVIRHSRNNIRVSRASFHPTRVDKKRVHSLPSPTLTLMQKTVIAYEIPDIAGVLIAISPSKKMV